MAVLGEGTALELSVLESDDVGRFLLLAGTPIREPIARYGPFVMNNTDELRTAVADFQSGRMGIIARS